MCSETALCHGLGWDFGKWSDTGFVPPGVKVDSISYRELIFEPVLKYLGQVIFSRVKLRSQNVHYGG